MRDVLFAVEQCVGYTLHPITTHCFRHFMRLRTRWCFMRRATALVCLLGVGVSSALANPVAARHKEGEVHAFLLVRSEQGKIIGSGDEVNVPAGRNWRSRLTLRFHDGSLDDETAVYTQGASFHLISDHHIQKGPSFPRPLDMSINTASGDVTYREEGRDGTKTEHMNLPADLVNGLLPMILQNVPGGSQDIKVGYVASTPKPRLVTVAVHREGQGRFVLGGSALRASQYRLHIEIGGFEGMVAPLIGKQPPDMSAWISTGDAPTFLKLDGFLYLGGPILQIEMTGPVWNQATQRTR